MDKRTREITALVLLVVLGIGVAAIMGWYLRVGHSWNVAASNIDDSIGEMEGYTVILFEGQVLPQTQRDLLSDSQPMLDDENRGLMHQLEAEEATEPLRVQDARASYLEKGANVITLWADQPSLYADTMITSKGGLRVGIVSFEGSTSRSAAVKRVRTLQKRDVDLIIALVSDARMISNPISGVDIVASTADEGLSRGGEYSHSAFCVDSPLQGQVQAVIMSPSNVLSSKTLTGL